MDSSPPYEPTSPSPHTTQQQQVPLLQRTLHNSPQGRYVRRHLERAPEPTHPDQTHPQAPATPIEVCETDAKFYNIPEGPIILALYAGKDDASSLEAAVQQEALWMTKYIYAIDVQRDAKAHDMLHRKLYGRLYYKALRSEERSSASSEDRTAAPGASSYTSPTCRANRDDRSEDARRIPPGGVLHKLTQVEWTKVDNDGLLLLRQIAIYEAAATAYPDSFFLLEHPADPADHST